MAKDSAGFTNFEIPGEVRNLAEQSVEQARKAFDSFMSATQKATHTLENQAATAQSGAKDIRQKALSFAEQNVATSFDFARRLVQARDPEEFLRLQTEFVQKQIEALSNQARILGETGSKAASEMGERRRA
jgi:phasin